MATPFEAVLSFYISLQSSSSHERLAEATSSSPGLSSSPSSSSTTTITTSPAVSSVAAAEADNDNLLLRSPPSPEHEALTHQLAKVTDHVAGDLEDDCGICQEPLIHEGHLLWALDPAVQLRKCHHHFHHDCLHSWLELGTAPTCPMCREVILEERPGGQGYVWEGWEGDYIEVDDEPFVREVGWW